MKKIDKHIEKAFALFPIMQGTLMLSSLLMILNDFIFSGLVVLLVSAYFIAPIIWSFVANRYGKPQGAFFIGNKVKEGNLWMVSFHLQRLYNSFPALENILRLVPTVYSSWLRLWGAEIGEKVNYTPELRIVDRPFVKIGDRVLLGNQTYITAHALKKKNDRYFLYLKPVEIGDDAVLAFRVTLAPGTVIGKRSFVEAGIAVYPNQHVEDGTSYGRNSSSPNAGEDTTFSELTQ